MTVESLPETVSRSESARNRTIIARLMAKLRAGLKDEVLAECEALETDGADHPAALYVLGVLAHELGVIKAAFEALMRAHERDPGEPVFAEMLAVLYAVAGNPREAVYYAKLSQSLGLDEATLALLPRSLPAFTQAMAAVQETPYLVKAEARAAARRHAEAVTFYEQHLAFFPSDPAGTRGIARTLLALNQPVRALAHLSDFPATGVTTAVDLSLLGEAYAALGNASAASASHEDAVTRDPQSVEAGCARLRDAVLDPGRDAAALAGLNAAWAATLPTEPRPPAAAIADRPPRVGYLVSAVRDPRDLEVVATVLSATDSRRSRRFVYGHGSIDDALNAGLHYCYDRWSDIGGCDAHTLAAIVRGDGIDVLVDTGGHAAPVHLAALALRPAPWQVSWLGNSGTLGLPQLDAELVDAYEFEAGDLEAAAPGGARRLAVAGGIHGYDRARPAGRTEPGRSGAFVFGADIRLPQLHADLLAAWARVLEGAPGARLALRDREFVDGNLLTWLVSRFSEVGIAERVDIVTADSATFGTQVDAMLAPFVELNPHDTAAALRQGAPVVALAGSGRHRRQSAALLRRCGLDALVAGDVGGYVETALGLARSPEAWRTATGAVARAVETATPFQPAAVAAGLQAALRTVAGLPA